MAPNFGGLLETFKAIRVLCGVPSVSIGVLHEGQTVFTKSIGLSDVEHKVEATVDSPYVLASISKSFVSASLGILVDEGKLKWTDLVSKHLPDFNPIFDPEIALKAEIVDLLRHSSGLSNPVVQVLGPEGIVISKEEDFMDFVNLTPTGNENGPFFNTVWQYSNINYSVAAYIVETVSGMLFADFVKQKILLPLNMKNTLLFKEDVVNHESLAHPYMQVEDGTFTKFRREWTDERRTSVLAAYGVRSSVMDLLTYCAALMAAWRQESDPPASGELTKSPLKQVGKIWQPAWTRPTDDKFKNESAYCLGWFRAVMPSSQVGWGSYNHLPAYDSAKTHLNYLIGAESPQRLMVKHTGVASGLLASMFCFPETQSAVVVLSNGGTFDRRC